MDPLRSAAAPKTRPPEPFDARARSSVRGAIDVVEDGQPSDFARMLTTTSDVTAEVIRFPEVPAAMKPAFDLFVRAGLDRWDALTVVAMGVDAPAARALIQGLIAQPGALASFGPKAVAVSVLARAAVASEASGRMIRSMVDAHAGMFVARPDGYLANALTGAAVERVGDVHSSAGRLEAGPLEVGALYASRSGQLYAVDAKLEVPPGAAIAYERCLDKMMYGHVLDGVEAAIVGTILSVGRFVEDPVRSTAEAIEAFGEIGAIVAATPELLERFLAMPANDQAEIVAMIATQLAIARAAGGAGAKMVRAGGAGLGGGAAGGEVLTWTLQLDFAAAGVGLAGVATAAVAPLAVAPLLAEAGPDSSLPELEEKALASMKRASQKLDKAEAAAKAKALPRIEQARQRLMKRLDELIEDATVSERSRANYQSLRNAMRDHMKPTDLTGALRDVLGIPVKRVGDGKVYSHLGEVEEALDALAGARASLVYEFQTMSRRGTVVPALAQLSDDLLEFKRALEAFLTVTGI